MPTAQKNTSVKSLPSSLLLEVDMIVNLEKGGRTYTNYKILGIDQYGVLFQGSVLNAPQTEKVFIPWASLEGVGIVG